MFSETDFRPPQPLHYEWKKDGFLFRSHSNLASCHQELGTLELCGAARLCCGGARGRLSGILIPDSNTHNLCKGKWLGFCLAVS